MKRISLFLLIPSLLLCLCSCGKKESVIVDNLLDGFKEDNTFVFYYKNDISGLNEDEYKIYYLSYDLNGDGENEDLTYLVEKGDTSKIILDAHDIQTGNNIAPRVSFSLDKTKIRVTDKKVNGYYRLIYYTYDEDGKVTARQVEEYSDGYYREK